MLPSLFRRRHLATLDTENANVEKGITTAEVKRLPQVGRDPYELTRLTPGIFGDGARSRKRKFSGATKSSDLDQVASNNSVFQVENQVQITANGQRISANNFEIDGVERQQPDAWWRRRRYTKPGISKRDSNFFGIILS